MLSRTNLGNLIWKEGHLDLIVGWQSMVLRKEVQVRALQARKVTKTARSANCVAFQEERTWSILYSCVG